MKNVFRFVGMVIMEKEVTILVKNVMILVLLVGNKVIPVFLVLMDKY